MSLKQFTFLAYIVMALTTPAIHSASIKSLGGRKVVLMSMDGFRYDYLNKTDTPNFDALIASGVKVPYVDNIFATLTFPSHHTIATVKFKKEFRNVFSRRGRHNTLSNHNECSWLPSTRAGHRHSDHTNLTAVRIMRTQDGGHSRLREANHKRCELDDINHSESV